MTPDTLSDALRCYLNDASAMEGVSELALRLKGASLEESAWNVVWWEDSHISYDYSRSKLRTFRIQTPSETLRRGSGVCVDYALLTAALLLEMNYSSIYVLHIEFSNSPIEHAAAAIKVNGSYFVIDQHPPVMDLGTYWKDWAYWRNESSNGTEANLFISRATVYELKNTSEGVSVEAVDVLKGEDFKSEDHTFTSRDLKSIVSDLRRKLLEAYPNLHLDGTIADIDTSKVLPHGYSDGITWRMWFPHFADYYNPLFHGEFVDYLYRHIVDSQRLAADLRGYTSFWLKAATDANGSVNIVINLAK
ncbi:protein of unknown function [Thermococcus nautili]|uniref:transglutaminase-like domain-containing protein n=1 Tax=Thermococcus nautili TaxID=195522 RepID=UPI002553D580|nr:transglutaminase-like domain-containing protein [Thermococcus nautili]CAI1492954.1 protein of unknown function [Thermococcus nautili]